MMRSSLIGSLASLLLLAGCPGPSSSGGFCDPNNLTDKPALCPDRLSFGFGQEFGSATFVGTSVPNTLTIRNGGIADLTIESVTLTGAAQFALSTSLPLPDGGHLLTLPASVPGDQTFFVQFLFTPAQPIAYTGEVTVKSNAANSPPADAGCSGGDWCFHLSGCGVPADGGTSACQRAVP
jgi:hypothetical protein